MKYVALFEGLLVIMGLVIAFLESLDCEEDESQSESSSLDDDIEALYKDFI